MLCHKKDTRSIPFSLFCGIHDAIWCSTWRSCSTIPLCIYHHTRNMCSMSPYPVCCFHHRPFVGAVGHIHSVFGSCIPHKSHIKSSSSANTQREQVWSQLEVSWPSCWSITCIYRDKLIKPCTSSYSTLTIAVDTAHSLFFCIACIANCGLPAEGIWHNSVHQSSPQQLLSPLRIFLLSFLHVVNHSCYFVF